MVSLRERIFEDTRKKLIASVHEDTLIIQTIHGVDELMKANNRLASLLRESYSLYAPEIARNAEQDYLLQAIKLKKQEEVSIPLNERDFKPLQDIAEEMRRIETMQNKQEAYLETLMQETCPHLLEAAGAMIGARLMAQAGSLQHLAEMASSKIQVLGAEKALFKHLKSKTRPPKFGIIFAHPLITEAKEKGKAARHVAANISKAAKIDYYGKQH